MIVTLCSCGAPGGVTVNDAASVTPLNNEDDAEIVTVFDAVTAAVVTVNVADVWFGVIVRTAGWICTAASLDLSVTELDAVGISDSVNMPDKLSPAFTESLLRLMVNGGFTVTVTVCVVRPNVAVR